jgi:thymidine kinase
MPVICVLEMSLNLVIGPMWAGKSSCILSKIRRYEAIGWSVMTITSSLDERYGSHVIANHDRDSVPAVAVTKLMPFLNDEKYKGSRLIVLEESQFFPDLVDFVLTAVEKDKKHVLCVGLDGDSERRPFGDILKLIPYCDTVEKITSLCSECGDGTPALFSYRCVEAKEEGQVLVGAKDAYKPLCRKHYLKNKNV